MLDNSTITPATLIRCRVFTTYTHIETETASFKNGGTINAFAFVYKALLFYTPRVRMHVYVCVCVCGCSVLPSKL